MKIIWALRVRKKWTKKGEKRKEIKRKRKHDINKYKAQHTTEYLIFILYYSIESKNFSKRKERRNWSTNSITILKPMRSGIHYVCVYWDCFFLDWMCWLACVVNMSNDLQTIVFLHIISFKPDDLAFCQYKEKDTKIKSHTKTIKHKRHIWNNNVYPYIFTETFRNFKKILFLNFICLFLWYDERIITWTFLNLYL